TMPSAPAACSGAPTSPALPAPTRSACATSRKAWTSSRTKTRSGCSARPPRPCWTGRSPERRLPFPEARGRKLRSSRPLSVFAGRSRLGGAGLGGVHPPVDPLLHPDVAARVRLVYPDVAYVRPPVAEQLRV